MCVQCVYTYVWHVHATVHVLRSEENLACELSLFTLFEAKPFIRFLFHRQS